MTIAIWKKITQLFLVSLPLAALLALLLTAAITINRNMTSTRVNNQRARLVNMPTPAQQQSAQRLKQALIDGLQHQPTPKPQQAALTPPRTISQGQARA